MESPEGFEDFKKIMGELSEVISGIEPNRNEIKRELESAKGKSLPDKLYHYTNSKGVHGIVQSNNLWATDFRALNDSSELIYGANLLIRELDNYAKEHGGFISELLVKLSSFYKEHGDAYRNFHETYIISFSEDPDVLSQWRAYSGQATGCCIEFDYTDSRLFTILHESNPWPLEVFPVIYDESLQTELVRSGIEKLLKYLDTTEWTVEKVAGATEMEKGLILGLFMHAFEPFVTTFKHPGFSEEREWRAIASCDNHLTDATKKERDTDYGVISYLECIFIQDDDDRLWQRELLPITGVKYGPLAEAMAKNEIQKHLKLNGYEHQVTYSRSEIPLKKR